VRGGEVMKEKFRLPFILLVTIVLLMAVIPSVSIKGEEQVAVPEEQIFMFTKPDILRELNINPLATTNVVTRGLTYEYLAIYDDVSTMYGQPGLRGILAESWRWVDDTTFEIKIRKIAHFRSGRPVTADDVIFSMEVEMRSDIAGPLAFLRDYIAGIEKVDDCTVHVKLKPEYARNKMMLWLLTGTFVLPKYQWAPLLEKYGANIVEYKPSFDEIDGSGPYTPIALPESAVIFKRVDNYWGEQLGWLFAPEYFGHFGDRSSDMMFRLIGEGKRDCCSLSAEISVEWQRERAAYLGAWNIYGDAHEIHGVEVGCKGIIFNFEKVPLFRERWLREAMIYALDYNKIAEAALYSQALPANHLSLYYTAYKDYIMMTKDILEKHFEHVVVDKGVPRLAYDPELAIKILKEHCEGSPEEGWTYKGQKLGPWKLLTVAGWRSWMTAAAVAAKCWNDIGIKVEVYPVELPVYFDELYGLKFDLAYNWIASGGFPTCLEQALTQLYGYAEIGPGWAGRSPLAFQRFWNGSYPPLPNIAGKVKELLDKLWTLEVGTAEFNETFLKICELTLPELAWIPTVEDGAMKIWNDRDRWVNWPTVDDPYPYRLWDTGVWTLCWHILQHVYPAKVKTVDFHLSTSEVEVNGTVIATVTLRNEGKYPQRYKIAINLGPPKPGWEITEEGLLAWKIVKVPPGTMTVDIPIKINLKPGSYVLVVDNWRIGEFDPGDPLVASLTVKRPVAAELTSMVKSISDTVSRVETTVNKLDKSMSELSDTLSTLRDSVNTFAGAVTSTSYLLYAIVVLQIIVLIAILVTYLKVSKSSK